VRTGGWLSARTEGETCGASGRGIAGRTRGCKRRRKPEVVNWVIPEDARAGGNGILIDGSAGDARFGRSKECIVGSTGEKVARRKPGGRRPVKPEGESSRSKDRRRTPDGGAGAHAAQAG